jgi:formimidoylglutamate deiminase
MRRTLTTTSSTSWQRPVRGSASAPPPRRTSDGFAPFERLRQRGIGICVGSDSNVRIDPLEELRELETTARRQALSREVFDAGTLLCFGADEGAASLCLESWPDTAIDLEHLSLRGVEQGDVLDALVFGCSADVVVQS